jgi:hypothetical protein
MVFCSQKTKKEKKKRVCNKWLLTDVGTDEQQADVWNNNTNPHQRTTQKWMNEMSINQTYIDVQKC